MKFVIVTGLSGSGKSEVMKVFEDMNYYCVDNLPPTLIVNLPKYVIKQVLWLIKSLLA